MVKRIRVDMSDRLFYTLVVVGLTILSVAVVYGYGTFEPAVFGHSLGELNLGVYDCNGNAITKINFSDGSVTCVGAGAGFDLLYGAHSSEQCTNLAGTVVDAGAGDICKFPSSSCPAGWAQYGSWSTTTSNSADCDAHRLYVGDDTTCSRRPYEGPICYTGGHAFSDTARESCTSTYNLVGWDVSAHCAPGCTGPNFVTAYAHITEMGCY
ncbi:hypothetical protein K8R30_04235 [archaeon]|nr:hypothetical protein [archaeon]